MRRLGLILVNDVRRHLKSPLAIIIYLIIPLAMTGMIGIIFTPAAKDGQLPPSRSSSSTRTRTSRPGSFWGPSTPIR